MPTTDTFYVNTASSPGGDGTTNLTTGGTRAFASLSEAESSLQTDLVSADKIYKIVCEGAAADSSNILFDGWTTDATRYIWVTTESAGRHQGVYSSSYYRIEGEEYFGLVRLREYMIFDGIQGKNTYTSGSPDGPGHGFQANETTATVIIENCILWKDGDTNNSHQCHGVGCDDMYYGSFSFVARNNIIYGDWMDGIFVWAESGQSDDIFLYNNTIVNALENGIYYNRGGTGSSSNLYLKNNLLENSGTEDYNDNSGSNGTLYSATNLTSDSSSPDGASYQSKSATFNDAGSSDYTLGVSDTYATDAGTDLSGVGSAQYQFSEDILGTDRSTTWSIGAHEPEADSGALQGLAATTANASGDLSVDGPQAVFSVQRGTHAFGASENSESVDVTAVSATSSAILRLTNVVHASGGPDATTTGNKNNDDLGARVEWVDTDTINFERLSSGVNEDVRCAYEICEYTGDASGSNEIIVRLTEEVTLSSGVGSTSSVAVTTVSDCVPFIMGITNSGTGRTWDDGTVTAEIVDTGGGEANVLLTANGTSGTTIVRVALVEFTGSNWTVQNNIEHTFSSAAANETETISDVSDWSTAFIVSTHRSANGDQGLDETGHNVWPGADTTSLRFRIYSGASTPTGHVCVAHVVQNDNLSVQHADSITGGGTNHVTGNNTTNVSVTAVDLSNASVIATSDCAGTGTAYPRQFWNYRLSSTTNVEFWRGRNGQPGDWALQVIEWPLESASGTEHSVDGSADVSSGSTGAVSLLQGVDGSADVSSGSTGSLQRGVLSSGGAAAVSSTTGSIDVTQGVSGDVEATSGVVGVGLVTRYVSGVTSVTTGAIGDSSVALGMSASIDVASGANGSVEILLAAVSSVNGSSDLTGAIEVERNAAGLITGDSGSVGQIITGISIVGESTTVSGVAGSVTTQGQIAIIGEVAIESVAAGTLELQVSTVGGVDVLAGASGQLGRSVIISSDPASAANATGAVNVSRGVASVSDAVSASTGALVYENLTLASIASVASSSSGELSVGSGTSGSIGATSVASGAVSRATEASGSISIATGGTGQVERGRAIATVVSLSSGISGSLELNLGAESAVGGASDGVGDIEVVLATVSAVDVAATLTGSVTILVYAGRPRDVELRPGQDSTQEDSTAEYLDLTSERSFTSTRGLRSNIMEKVSRAFTKYK